MFAIIATGAKQYLVRENDEIYIEKIDGKIGDEIIINKVFAVNAIVGKPTLPDAFVTCRIEKQGKQKKIKVIKHISQKHHLKKYGHRQPYTKLKIVKINFKNAEE